MPTYSDTCDVFINGTNAIYGGLSQIYKKTVNTLGEYTYSGNTITISPGLNTI